MAVATGLHSNPWSWLMSQVLPHHGCGTAQESEWACQHPFIANGNQLWNAGTIACRQDRYRVAMSGPKQFCVLFARRPSAQPNAMVIALGKRGRRCRSHRGLWCSPSEGVEFMCIISSVL